MCEGGGGGGGGEGREQHEVPQSRKRFQSKVQISINLCQHAKI